MIKPESPCCNAIGFAIVRQGFEYFTDRTGFSVGIDIPEGDARNKGLGSVAVRKLLLKLKIDRPGINTVYLETLSYNVPIKRIAEKIGFRQIASKDVAAKYQDVGREELYV